MNPADGPNFLSVAQAAATVSLSTKTIYRLIDEGKIPSIRIGGSIRIPMSWRNELLRVAEVEHRTAREAANS